MSLPKPNDLKVLKTLSSSTGVGPTNLDLNPVSVTYKMSNLGQVI